MFYGPSKFGRFALIVFFIGIVSVPCLSAMNGIETDGVVLYQAEDVLKERALTQSSLIDYVKRLETVYRRFFSTVDVSETLDIVVAVRPGKLSRIWLASSTHPTPDPGRESLRRELESVPACEILNGPIAFAIITKVAGGDGRNPSKGDNSVEQPFPQEWVDASAKQKRNLLVPDDILDLIWPIPL